MNPNLIWHQSKEIKTSLKSIGIRATLRRFGWRLLALVFALYLIRDLTLYVLVPYFWLSS